jgi:hypothetical protein
LGESSRWYAEAFAWHHARLQRFFERPNAYGCVPLWRTYLSAKARAKEPLYFRTDSHHTPHSALLVTRAIVETCAPGLWQEKEIHYLGTTDKFGDLSIFIAGQLGSRPELEEEWEVRRPGVELVSGAWPQAGLQLPGGPEAAEAFWQAGVRFYGPHTEWEHTSRLLNRSRGARLIPGKTLILMDSQLAKSRESLRQFFADVTFRHYDDVIAADDFGEALAGFDRVIVEIGERFATQKMEALLRPVRTRVLRQYDGVRQQDLVGNGEVHWQAEGRDLLLDAAGTDPILYLASLSNPGPGDYELRAQIESPQTTAAQLFYQTALEPEFSEAQSSFRKLKPGENVVYFPLTAEQVSRPLRFDPGAYAGRYRLHSLQLRRWLDAEPARTGWASAPAKVLWIFQANADRHLLRVAEGSLALDADARLSRTGLGLEIELPSNGEIRLPLLRAARSGRPELHLEVEASTAAVGGILSSGEATSGQTWQLRPGRNLISCALLPSDLLPGVRFQPGWRSGRYRVQGITLTGVCPEYDAADLERAAGIKNESWTAYLKPVPEPSSGVVYRQGVQGNGEVSLQPTETGLKVLARGTDPQLLFPPAQLAGTGLGLVRIEMDAPVRTLSQLFFLKPGMQDYQEKASLSQEAVAGRNAFWFVVPFNGLERIWRFDPGCHPGTYTLFRVEVWPLDLHP